jgi:hypothetical protein
MNCLQTSLGFRAGTGANVLDTAFSERTLSSSSDWVLPRSGFQETGRSKAKYEEAAIAALQLPSFLPPAGLAILGCGTGCCLVALGWSFESVRRYGIQAPRAFTGCGVGIGFGCVGVGQGFGRYVPWAKDTRPPSLRKDLKQSVDDVVRFFHERFRSKSSKRTQHPPLSKPSSEPKETGLVPPTEPAPKTTPSVGQHTRPQRCIEVRE